MQPILKYLNANRSEMRNTQNKIVGDFGTP